MATKLPLILLLFSVISAMAAPLRIGSIDVAPFGLMSNEGELDGIFVQMANRVVQKANLPYTHLLYPSGRLYVMLEHHQLDLAVSSRNLDRDLGLVRLGKLWELEGVIVYRSALPLQVRKLDDLAPYLIGRLNGTCPTLAKAGMRLYSLNDYNQGLRMLAAGRLDGLCGDRASLRYSIQRSAMDLQSSTQMLTFLRTDVWLFANPALDGPTQLALRNATEDLYKSGTAQRLVERFLPGGDDDRKAAP
ncbi:substrate-binding periplasmic protein [Chitinimonas sp.]|uniref:substrate-binding periplasmic protein n=1 Tax=Chitinimonas sp. TaxID=1934313 RepID=UPI0035AE67C4